MSKYDDMKAFYEKCLHDKSNEADHWRERYINAAIEVSQTKGKLELYEQILSKVLIDTSDNTDDIVIFEGKIYKTTGFTLTHNEGEADTLSVECVRVALKGE